MHGQGNKSEKTGPRVGQAVSRNKQRLGMEHAIPELDRQGLREFGLITGGFIAGLFGLFFPWLLDAAIPYWPWVVGGVLALWALMAPATLRSVYGIWMRFALLLSRITTPLIMGLVYCLAITPVAFIMRLIGHDPMARRFDEKAKSYRIPSKKAPKDQMERPF